MRIRRRNQRRISGVSAPASANEEPKVVRFAPSVRTAAELLAEPPQAEAS